MGYKRDFRGPYSLSPNIPEVNEEYFKSIAADENRRVLNKIMWISQTNPDDLKEIGFTNQILEQLSDKRHENTTFGLKNGLFFEVFEVFKAYDRLKIRELSNIDEDEKPTIEF